VSTFYRHTLDCPACGVATEVNLAKGLHITRLPEVRAEILAGTFQVFDCPACGARAAVEARTVYTDFDRRQYVAVEPGPTADWAEARRLAVEVFDAAFTFGPPVAEELAGNMRCRLVFGMRSLREKLLIWDAGLDDRVVEALKADWLRRRGLELHAEVLRVVAVHEGGHILLARFDPAPPLPEGVLAVQRAAAVLGFETFLGAQYERRLSLARQISGDYPFLQDPWVVDVYANA
jgi:hypothetical protein